VLGKIGNVRGISRFSGGGFPVSVRVVCCVLGMRYSSTVVTVLECNVSYIASIWHGEHWLTKCFGLGFKTIQPTKDEPITGECSLHR